MQYRIEGTTLPVVTVTLNRKTASTPPPAV